MPTVGVDPLRHSNDAIVTKTFCSAFKESGLEEILVERNVRQLYFGGLLSNMCVLATSLSAICIALQRQNWEIYVVIDALGGGDKKAIEEHWRLSSQNLYTIL
jgi:nicotinamidase-related amidase